MYEALQDVQEMLETVRCAESSSLWSSFFPFIAHDAIGSSASLTKCNLRVWIPTHINLLEKRHVVSLSYFLMVKVLAIWLTPEWRKLYS